MTKLVVAAVVVLALTATADVLRQHSSEKAAAETAIAASSERIVHPTSASGFVAAGQFNKTRVLRYGREYLSAGAIGAAFPTSLRSAAFDIAHLAARPDGTIVVAIYAFPQSGPGIDGVEVWRQRRLQASFTVPLGSFGGGIGFAADGRLVAALAGDGALVRLFTRDGRFAGQQLATTW
jgi:hypothetical protein